MKSGVSNQPTLCSERKNKNRALRKGWGTLFIERIRDSRKGGPPVQPGRGTVKTDALEPPGKPDPKGNGSTRMPEGVYPGKKINPRTQSSVGAIVEVEVPGHTGVRIHPGNIPKNTEGCILPGTASAPDSVSGSKPAVNEINDYLNTVIKQDQKNGDSTTITVVMTDLDTRALAPVTIDSDPPPASSPFTEVDNGIPPYTAVPAGAQQQQEPPQEN